MIGDDLPAIGAAFEDQGGHPALGLRAARQVPSGEQDTVVADSLQMEKVEAKLPAAIRTASEALAITVGNSRLSLDQPLATHEHRIGA